MVVLKPLKSDDCSKIVEWNNDKDADFLCQWAGPNTYVYPLDQDQIKLRLSDKNVEMFKIMKSSEMIGTFELRRIQNYSDSLCICCFLIDPKQRGKRYGQITLQKIKEYAFADPSVCRLYLNVFVYNVNAIRCYERAGFCVESLRSADNPKWNSFSMSLRKQA